MEGNYLIIKTAFNPFRKERLRDLPCLNNKETTSLF